MEKINTVFGGEAPVRTDVFVAQAADITRQGLLKTAAFL